MTIYRVQHHTGYDFWRIQRRRWGLWWTLTRTKWAGTDSYQSSLVFRSRDEAEGEIADLQRLEQMASGRWQNA